MIERKPVVLVTGASGFVGRHVVPMLARDGWSVRRAVRMAEGLDGEVVIPSIGPDTVWQMALADVDAVVHLAARVHHKREEHAADLYRMINSAGTLQLARSAAEAGVGQFIFISTVLVHGRSNAGRAPFSEEDTLTPHGVYGISKAEAEAGLKALASETDMKISTIRPPLVYGAGAKGNFALLTRAVSLGFPLPLADIHNQRAFVAVQNLSSFIAYRLAHPDSNSNFETFLVADKEQISTPEFISRLAKASGTHPKLFGMSPGLLRSFLSIIGRQETCDSLLGSLELDISKAIGTGWRPQVSLDEGLRLALAAQDA
ncbi:MULTISPECIES: NAD-dependent epimerase/dehydratase family protein [Bradyrhizobium]|uniref:NAD-dependent epimerase/dehydratase family protein n=1 Tax=Bradyrhizobium TaxID=374 RepID=UPI001EDB055D|nr:NAD-dependent epimerase/dehydratase family protein [Bradyrhizobium zhengyangense]MCG2643488.1 NAD-dependent epimerase/dehydratase family protein [Bradyrhizobium zhengyangense]